MPGFARLKVLALDCPDPNGLAAFYSAITGWAVESEDTEWVQLRNESGPTLAFQLAPDHQPPVWPSADHPQQAHLDFAVKDLDEGESQVLALGARKAEVQPSEEWRVFLDPAGHPFCFVLEGH